MNKYTPMLFIFIYGGICGAYFVGGDDFFDIIFCHSCIQYFKDLDYFKKFIYFYL